MTMPYNSVFQSYHYSPIIHPLLIPLLFSLFINGVVQEINKGVINGHPSSYLVKWPLFVSH